MKQACCSRAAIDIIIYSCKKYNNYIGICTIPSIYVYWQSEVSIVHLVGFQNVRKQFRIMDSFTLTNYSFLIS